MRKIIFSLLFSFLALAVISQNYNLNISGTVTNENTGEPVVQHMINIAIPGDSLNREFFYFNTVLTDENGYYEEIISVPNDETGDVFVETFACGMPINETGNYSANNNVFVFDFAVCSDSIPNGECQAMFTYYPGETPNSVIFEDYSFGNPENWNWSFGDGETSIEQNPIHQYAGEGEYFVTLEITGDNGNCSSIYEMPVYVDFDSIPNGECQAMFTYYPGETPNSVIFEDYSFGNPENWNWSFGDGETSIEQNPIHQYAGEGEYFVTLEITGDNGNCSSIYEMPVYIGQDTIGNCMTWFEYEIDNLSVNFVASFEGSGVPTYSWEFGDGVTAEGETVSHTYSEDGAYHVVLTTVADNGMCFTSYYEVLWLGEDFSFPVSGYVYLQDSMMADYANVYLATFDTLGNNIVNVASTQVDANGYYEFEEVGFENCLYFVQAELNEASSYYGDYVPTYHFSSMYWEEAMPVFPFFMEWSYDIFMIPDISLVNGNGNIMGVVNSNESRGLVADVEILLLDQNNKPITYLKTDENGEFEFPELNYGTYTIHTEVVGVETTPITVTISEDKPTANIAIVIANGEAVLGLDKVSSYVEEVGNITPNPVAENSAITISLREESMVTIQLVSQYGQFINSIERNLNTGKNEVSLQTSSLPQGVYVVNIISEDGVKTSRKLVKLR
jgi:PKD repeat protein